MRPAQKQKGTVSVRFGSPERVEWHLLNWARWMRSGNQIRGLPGRATLLSSGGKSKDFDEMADSEERKMARNVDTIIHDLKPIEVMAIHHKYLYAVYRFPRENLADLLAGAKVKIGASLNKKGIW